MKKKYLRFPDGSIGPVADDKYQSAIEAGAADYAPGDGVSLYEFEDGSFGEVTADKYEAAGKAGGQAVDFAVKKKEQLLSFPDPFSLDFLSSGKKAAYAASSTPVKPVMTERVKRGLKLNPFFQQPTLDQPSVQAVPKEQALGSDIAVAEEGRTIERFLESPTPAELDDDSKRDVLDLVFARKETELNLQGKLDAAAKSQLQRERNRFSERFYTGELTGYDLDDIYIANPIAFNKTYGNVSSEDAAGAINNKTKNLATWARGVNEAGAKEYTVARSEVEGKRNQSQEQLDQLVATNYITKVGDGYVTNIPDRQYMADQANALARSIEEADLKLTFVKQDFEKLEYKPHREKVFNEQVLSEIQKGYLGMKPEDIYKWEGGTRMMDDDDAVSQLDAIKKLHANPNFRLSDVIKYDPLTNQLTPESVVKVRELVTSIVNKTKDPIIEAYEHQEVGRGIRQGAGGVLEPGQIAQDVTPGKEQGLPINPEDLINRTINYFNYELPAKVLAQGYTNKWKKTPTGQKISSFIDSQGKLQEINNQVTAYESGLKASLDSGYVNINDKYAKILSTNPVYNGALTKWRERAEQGLITPEQAESEFMKELNTDLSLKPILDAKRNEVDRLRNTANTQREKFIINSVGALNNQLTLDKDGRLTVKGMTREEVDAAIKEYEDGYGAQIESTYKGQSDALAKRADFINTGLRETFGGFGGAFMSGVTGAVDDLGGAVSRWIYHKTGEAGDGMNYFEGQRSQPLGIGEYADKHYRYKGASSLLDPAYYGFATGQSFPYAAPGLVLGVATGGTVPGIIAASIGGATLETAENALIARNELFMEGRDRDGLKITSKEADHIAAEQFGREILPNIAFQAVELGSLLRATKYANPGLTLKTGAIGLRDVVVGSGLAEAAQEGVQGYVQATQKQRAAGQTESDFFDYMQTEDFADNFFGGFAGGITMGAGVKPMAYAQSLRNWKGLLEESKAVFAKSAINDFATGVPFANAMHAEMNGAGAEFRDGIRLRIENGQYNGVREKENLSRTLLYSEKLSGAIKNEGIIPTEVNQLYAAHEVAMADTYESLADRDKGLSSQSKVYQKQATQHRNNSIAALNGEAEVYYAIDRFDRPVFMNRKTAEVLANGGVFDKWSQKGYVKTVNSINAEEFNAKILPRQEAADIEESAPVITHSDIVNRAKALVNTNSNWKTTLDKVDNTNMEQAERELREQTLDTPGGTVDQFSGNENFVVDALTGFDIPTLEARIKYFTDQTENQMSPVDLENIDRHVRLLDKAIEIKQSQNDSQNQTGIPSQVREGEEFIQTESQQGASGTQAQPSGVLQAQEGQQAVAPENVVPSAVSSSPAAGVYEYEGEKYALDNGGVMSNEQGYLVPLERQADITSRGVFTPSAPAQQDVEDTRSDEENEAAETDYADRERQVRQYMAANNVELAEEDIDDVVGLIESGEDPKEAIDFVKFGMPEEMKQDKRSAGGAIRNALKINLDKLTGGGGIQSNLIGIPVAAWNLAIDAIAAAVDGGVALATAVRRGYDVLKQQFPNVDESAAINALDNLVRGLEEKPVRRKGERYGQYAMRVLDWRRKMLDRGRPEQQNDALSQSQTEMNFIKNVNAGIELLNAPVAQPDGTTKTNLQLGMTNAEFNRALGLPVGDTITYIGALKYLKGSNKEATQQLNELRRANPKQVVMTEMALLKKQLKDFERGYIAGDKDANEKMKKIRDDINDILKEFNEEGFLAGIKYTPTEILRMGSYVNSAINEDSLNAFRDMMVKLIEKADYGRKLSEVKEKVRKIKKILKKKTGDERKLVTANMMPVIKDIAKLKAMRVSDIDKFNEILSDIIDSQFTKENPIPSYSRDTLVNYIAEQKVYDIEQTGKEVMDKFYDLTTDENFIDMVTAGKVANAPSEQQLQNVVNGIMSDTTKSYSETIKQLDAIYDQLNRFHKDVTKGAVEMRKTGNTAIVDYNATVEKADEVKEDVRTALEDLAKAQQASIDTSIGTYTDEQKRILDVMKNLDVTGFDANTLRLFMNVLNNVVQNEDFTGSGVFEVKARAQSNMNKLKQFLSDTGRKITEKRKARTSIRKGLRNTRESLSSTEQELLEIASNDPASMVEVVKSVEFDKIKAGWAKTVHTLKEKLTSRLQELADSGAIDTKDVRSQFRLAMFSWLNQSKTDALPQERIQEFAKRLGEVKEDIAIKEASGDEDNVAESKVLQEVYVDLVGRVKEATGVDLNGDITGKDASLLNDIGFLQDGEIDAYNVIREFHDEFRPQFIDIMERVLNKEFIGYDNYMVDKTRKLKGGLADTDISESGFFQQSSKDMSDDESGSFAGRVEGNRIVRRPATEDTRVIDYRFFNNTISNARDTLYDINTIEDRQVANEVVSSKDMQDTVGQQKAGMLKNNLLKEIQTAVGFKQNNNEGMKVFSDSVNVLSRLAAKKNLYGLMALPKQFISALGNTMGFMGIDAPYVALAAKLAMSNDDVAAILDDREISLRGQTKGGTSVGADDVVTEGKGLAGTDIGKAFSKVDKALSNHKEFTGDERKLMGYFLEAGDVYGAKATWVALYAKYLKNNGFVDSLTDIDWANERKNLNRDAAIFADVTTSAQLNTNSKNALGKALLNNDFASNVLRGMYALFGMFGINKSINSYLKLKSVADSSFSSALGATARLFTGQISKDAGQAQVDYATKGLVAGLFEDLMFAAIKFTFGKLTLMWIGQMLAGALGDDEGKEVLQKGIDKAKSTAGKDITTQALGNFLFSFAGNIGQDKLQKASNWIHEQTGGENKIFQTIPDNPNMKKAAGLSGASGLEDMLGDVMRGFRLYFDKTDRDGNNLPELTPKQNKMEKAYAITAMVHDMAQFFGVGDADFERMLQTRLRAMDRDIGKRYKDDYWMNVADQQTRELTFGGRARELTDAQAKFYKKARTERFNQLSNTKLTQEKKMEVASEYGKAQLLKEYGAGALKVKEPAKK